MLSVSSCIRCTGKCQAAPGTRKLHLASARDATTFLGVVSLICSGTPRGCQENAMTPTRPGPSKWKLFRIWASVGLQSFGGGASTTFLIQRAFIEKHKWLSMEEFTHLWNLCILTPGINLIALTVLIGKKLGGTWGIVASLAGMLLPSAAITCLLAAIFKQIEHVAAVQAVLRGVVPATGGIMLLVGLNFALPLIRRSHKVGLLYLVASSVLIIACALAVIFLKLSVILVLLAAVFLGALFFSRKPVPPLLIEEERGKQQ